MAANASAAGGNVGVGGSFGISIANDSSRSSMRRSNLKSTNVKVNSTSSRTKNSTVRAGANGAAEESERFSGAGGTSGGSDSLADGRQTPGRKGISAVRSCRQMAHKNTKQRRGSGLSKDRQKGQTTEGSIQVEAGLFLYQSKSRKLTSQAFS